MPPRCKRVEPNAHAHVRRALQDGASDPMHYCQPVYAAVNAVLLSMVCDGAACDADDGDGR